MKLLCENQTGNNCCCFKYVFAVNLNLMTLLAMWLINENLMMMMMIMVIMIMMINELIDNVSN